MSGMGRGPDPRAAGGPGRGQGWEKDRDLGGGGANHNEGASLDCKEGRVGEEPWFERRNLRSVGPTMKGGANKVRAGLIVSRSLMAQMACSDE